jgi:hypothetical protein
MWIIVHFVEKGEWASELHVPGEVWLRSRKMRAPGLPRPRRSWKKEEKIQLYYIAIGGTVLYARRTIVLR